jgi:hypothetical protein
VRAGVALAIIGEPPPPSMTPQPLDTPNPDPTPPYFPVARHKLIVMSLATLSTYQLYWFYKNFEMMAARKKESGSAFWRALFAPITAHGLFAQVRLDARSRFITVGWSAGGLAVIYFILNIACFLSYPWWLLALASVFAVLPVHATAEAVNAIEAPNGPRNDIYSTWNIIAIVVGIALTIVGIIATRQVDLLIQQLESQL